MNSNARTAAGAVVVAGVLVVLAVFVVARLGSQLGTVPIDGCYYLAKAFSFGESLSLRVPWGDGIDAKFFPGLSILFALPVKLLGYPWGWILVESASLAGSAWLVAALSRRLGAGAIGAAAAAAAFAVDPLVVKWTSVPYAEIPAVLFALTSLECAFRARDSQRRFSLELAAALALGVAGSMRVEAFVAAPILGAIAASRRSRAAAVKVCMALGAVALLPVAAHVAVMASFGIVPSRLHYFGEFLRKFEFETYVKNVGELFRDLAHWTPPKRNVLDAMPRGLGAAQAGGRMAVLFLSALGSIFWLGRREGRVALGLLFAYPLMHALWHYSDGRFLLVVWPIVAMATGMGAERLVQGLTRTTAAVGGALLTLAGLAMLLTGLWIANSEIASWENVTGGSARELAARIDALAGPEAEGIYEFEMDTTPRVVGGPFVAMFRRAPARFAYSHDEFFEPHVAPAAVPALLTEGNRFVLTNLSYREWLGRRVVNPVERGRYRALLEEPGHTLIVAAR